MAAPASQPPPAPRARSRPAACAAARAGRPARPGPRRVTLRLDRSMATLRTQRDFRPLQKLSFCYLCGRPFGPEGRSTGDHVPPRTVFLKSDRSPVLKLPVHDACNQRESTDDEVFGQFISLLHGAVVPREKQRFRAVSADLGGEEPFAGVTGVELNRIIWRWVRGFHAALYREVLPLAAWYGLTTPFPHADQVGGTLKFQDLRLDQMEMALTLRQQIKYGRIDEILSCSGKCRFVCSWLTSDDGSPFCLYGLRIYAWEKLADTKRFPPRGCVGIYPHPTPPGAALGTKIILPSTAFTLFDPFQ